MTNGATSGGWNLVAGLGVAEASLLTTVPADGRDGRLPVVIHEAAEPGVGVIEPASLETAGVWPEWGEAEWDGACF